ncbi:MAG TPA: FtsQ-type POTRA domain-containing protein [Dictyobacter sp.]|nr:FtsQ-type POTRA domain-containing protein [Dictyobacter sp.]
MTEKKKLPEQRVAHHYDVGSSVYRPNRNETLKKKERTQKVPVTPNSFQRTVTVPETDLSMAWDTFAQRKKRLQRVRPRPQKYVSVPRTLAQTGVRATSGRMYSVKRPLPYNRRQLSSVPLRRSRRRARRGRLWKFVGIVILLILLIMLLNFLVSGSVFRIAHIQVIGTHNQALIQQVQQMGGMGQNIFFLNVEGMQEHIDMLPLVQQTEVQKHLPDQITVSITERLPAMLWQTSQGSVYEVDRDGMILTQVSPAGNTGHLGTVIDITDQGNAKDQTEPQLHPGAYIRQTDIPFALAILQNFPKVTGINVFKLYYDGTMYASNNNPASGNAGSRGSYIVESPAGWKAYLGGAQDANSLDNRLIELQGVLTLAQQQSLHVATIDLRYGLRPVFTLQQ